MLSRYHADMSWLLLVLVTCTHYCTFSIARFRAIFNSHEMKSYVKPNVVGDFLDNETCSSIGEVVFQPSPVLLTSTSLASHTLVACKGLHVC